MKVQNPIIGRSRGSAGGMTFCKNYDKNVARAKAFEVSNPKTALQTNQRTFFKEVMDITKTVSDEELRSLFGIKPKAMSRRNALSKQIAAAYNVDDGQKVVDFSKLQAIGNGEKVTTPFFVNLGFDDTVEETYTLSMFGSNATPNSRVYAVIFSENKGIIIIDTEMLLSELSDLTEYWEIHVTEEMGLCCGYLTIATDGSTEQRAFGTFTIKTRKVTPPAPAPGPQSTIDVYANGTTTGSYAHFNADAYLQDLGYEPIDMTNGEITVIEAFSFDTQNNWYAGSLASDLNLEHPIYITFEKSSEERFDVPVNWIVQ